MHQSTPKRYFSTPVNTSIPPLDISASTVAPVNEHSFNSLTTSTHENRTPIQFDGSNVQSPECNDTGIKAQNNMDLDRAPISNLEYENVKLSTIESVNKYSRKEGRQYSPSLNTHTAWHITGLENKNIECFKKVGSGSPNSNQPLSSNSNKAFCLDSGGKASSLQRVLSGTSSSDKNQPLTSNYNKAFCLGSGGKESSLQRVISGTSSSDKNQPLTSNSNKAFCLDSVGKASSLQKLISGTSSSDKVLHTGSIKSVDKNQKIAAIGSISNNSSLLVNENIYGTHVIKSTSTSISKNRLKKAELYQMSSFDKNNDPIHRTTENAFQANWPNIDSMHSDGSSNTSFHLNPPDTDLYQMSSFEKIDNESIHRTPENAFQANWPKMTSMHSDGSYNTTFHRSPPEKEMLYNDNLCHLSSESEDNPFIIMENNTQPTNTIQKHTIGNNNQFLYLASTSADIYNTQLIQEVNSYHVNSRFTISNNGDNHDNISGIESPSNNTRRDVPENKLSFEQFVKSSLNQSPHLAEIGESPFFQRPKILLKRKANIEISKSGNLASPKPNKTLMDTETASKLTAFSARLKALKSPAPVSSSSRNRSTNRSEMMTPLNNRQQSSSSDSVMGRSGTTTPMATINNMPEAGCIVALVEGRGNAKGEVGLAAISISHPVLILCQFSDSPTYPRTLTKLSAINPAEILIPGIGHEGTTGSKLYDDLDLNLPLANVVIVQRKHFSESKGVHAIKSLCAPEFSSVELQFNNKFYCLAAVSSLLKYLEFSENIIFMPKSLKVEYQVSENSTIIDPETANHIELINCLVKRKNHLSLFNVMNKCSTAGGTRLLRANLFQPPVDLMLITKRLDTIEELINSQDLQTTIKSLLTRYPDVYQILTLCVLNNNNRGLNFSQVDAKMNKVIGLKQILELASPLQATLASATSPLLSEMSSLLSRQLRTCSTLLEMVQLVIQDSVNLKKGSNATKFQRAFAIKQGVNPLLDLGRNKYCDITQEIVDYSTTLSEEYGLPIRLKSNPNRGFYFELPITNQAQFRIDDLPDTFILQQKSKHLVTFVTQDLMVMDRLFQKTVEELSRMSDAIIDELLVEIRGSIGFLYSLSEALSNLDLIMSLAEVSSMNDFVKPEFGENMEIRKGRHPLLDQMPIEVTPNYVMANFGSRLHIITGPNMSGKSTYLRQIVLLQIMAQVGCYIPGEFACFRIADRIFSRVSNRDSIEANASTFMLEMQETAYILANVGDSSLIIIDELGRGTSVDEGSGICWAICEKLMETTCFTFLATHFPLLTKLAGLYPWVSNHHFLTKNVEIEGEQQKRDNTHLLVNGTAPPSTYRYGIQLASISSLPKEVIDNSRLMAEKLVENETPVQQLDPIDRGVADLVIQLKRLGMSGLKGDELKEQLKILQVQYLEKLEFLVCGEEEELN